MLHLGMKHINARARCKHNMEEFCKKMNLDLTLNALGGFFLLSIYPCEMIMFHFKKILSRIYACHNKLAHYAIG